MFSSCNQGLLNIRTHIILFPNSHLSHNHNAFLFGVSKAEVGGEGGEINSTWQKNCIGFSVKQIFTQMLNMEIRKKDDL